MSPKDTRESRKFSEKNRGGGRKNGGTENGSGKGPILKTVHLEAKKRKGKPAEEGEISTYMMSTLLNTPPSTSSKVKRGVEEKSEGWRLTGPF